MQLGLILEMAVADDPERAAVVDADGNTITRGALQSAANAFASRALDAGATTVGYLSTNHVAFPVALFGAAAAGIPFVPLNYRLSDGQLRGLLAKHDRMVVVVDGSQAAREPLARVTTLDRNELRPDVASPSADDPPVTDAGDDEIAVLLYTSGTTSEPKAAILRHRHLTSYVVTTVEFGGATTDDAVLVCVPPYHIAGVSNLLTNIYSGRRLVYLDPFDARRWLEIVASERITHAMVVPTMLARIVDALGDDEGPALPSLAYGGAKMPRPVLERALRLFPRTAFTNAYGLTETSSTVALLGPDDHRAALAADDPAVRARLDSAGRPLPGVEIEIRDDDGRRLPPGRTGDVYVRGEQVSGEYLDAATAVSPDGWLATRDRGHLDGEGYLFIEGRADDTIIRGGENIAPAEIEDVILTHDQVAECAVVGVPDEEWGQRIAAAVVPREGAVIDAGELRSWVRARLRSSKTPDDVLVRPALPYTETGKLLRRVVRGWFDGDEPRPPS